MDKDCKNEELINTQNKAMHDVIHELVRQVTSPHTLVRETAMSSLRLIAELQSKTVTEVMDPHRNVLADMIPPKKHLLRHQSASAQIGLIEGNTFCTTLEPRLFTIDLKILTHKVFFHEVLTLSEADDNILNKLDCYKSVTNLTPLRKSALRALSACHYIDEPALRTKIFQTLFKALGKPNAELQECAFECLQRFMVSFPIDKHVHTEVRPLLMALGDYRNLNLNNAKHLSYSTQLFPSVFNEKLCEQLMAIVKNMLDASINSNRGRNFLAVSKVGETEQKIATVIGIFHQIPAASAKFIDSLCRLILKTEKALNIEPSCPYRPPLIKFLLKHPDETLELLLSDTNIIDPQWNRFTIYILKAQNGEPFRKKMQEKNNRIIHLIMNGVADTTISSESQHEAQHQAVLILFTLAEFDDQWLAVQTDVITALRNIWANNLFDVSPGAPVVNDLWHLVAKILQKYFTQHSDDIDLLFQLLRALCLRLIPDFQFLRDFLQETVCHFTIDWKRKAFFYFVENFHLNVWSQDLKAKILTVVLIPCFAVSFEKGEGNKLVGAPPAPYQEDDNNVVSVFINKVSENVNFSLCLFICT